MNKQAITLKALTAALAQTSAALKQALRNEDKSGASTALYDQVDLEDIYNEVEDGNFKIAAELFRNMDTAVRDMVVDAANGRPEREAVASVFNLQLLR